MPVWHAREDIVTKALGSGGRGTVVVISLTATALLDGATPTAALWARVEEAVSREVRPIDDIRGSAAYRRSMAGVMGRRVLEAAYMAAHSTATTEGR